jgi:hypothetical protein
VGDVSRPVKLGRMEIDASGEGVSGGRLPDGLEGLDELRLLDPHGREVAEATIEH